MPDATGPSHIAPGAGEQIGGLVRQLPQIAASHRSLMRGCPPLWTRRIVLRNHGIAPGAREQIGGPVCQLPQITAPCRGAAPIGTRRIVSRDCPGSRSAARSNLPARQATASCRRPPIPVMGRLPVEDHLPAHKTCATGLQGKNCKKQLLTVLCALDRLAILPPRCLVSALRERSP
ncbi:hypothetical protein NDU88_007319 [Pleurodeles waltl]|uniref:Uncharacterized protein n=1 Tax=Pleurodeles waltl TaxID=8319 RepID=A0AAV7VS58_PLEWA|nr:hypothetical protein NDU88_007319 [Pleurodeles waltl]